jgi:HK97 family phage portal protein
MRLFDFLRGQQPERSPMASVQDAGGGTLIVSPQQLEEALRTGSVSEAGIAVTPDTALRVGAVFACVRLLSSPIATLPFDIKRRVDERTRADASDHWAYQLLRRRPNKWQKPHQFKRMMQAHILLRGNAYALKVRGVGGRIQALVPMHPDRVRPKQLDDWSMVYEWTRKDGRLITLKQDDVFHMFGLTLDGITGVTPLTYARETIGVSLAMDRHVGKVMQKGARAAGAVGTDRTLTDKAFGHLKESLAEFRQDGDQEGAVMILEEGLKWSNISMSPQDLQWIEARKLTRSDVAMFYGVPPFMLGDNSGSDSNWGTGLEQKTEGFKAFTLEDYLTMWEEGVNVDLLGDADPTLYARFNRAALVRSDLKTRYAAYREGRNGGWLSKNDIRAFEEMNPIADGDNYDAPLNSNAAPSPDQGNPDETTPPHSS